MTRRKLTNERNSIRKPLRYAGLVTSILGAVFVSERTASASDQTDFVSKVGPASQRVTTKYGLYASVQLAQASLESGWGQSALSVNENNYFGIKGSYNGQSAIYNTAEMNADGSLYYVDAAFKKYPSIDASMEDNAILLRNGLSFNSSFYAGTWRENASSFRDAANALTGKYATDQGYGAKLINLITTYGMDRYDYQFDNITSVNSVLKVGTIRQSGRNDGIYEKNPWNVVGNTFWESANKFEGMHVLVDSETKTSNSNNVTWASYVQTSGVRAYFDEAALSGLADVETVDLNAYFVQSKSGRNDGLYKTAPNNFLGNDYKGTISQLGFDNKYVHISKKIDIDGVTWYGGQIGGELRWFDSRAVDIDNSAPVRQSYSAVLKQNGRNDGIYKERPWTFDGQKVADGQKYDGKDVIVTGEWTTPDGNVWAEIKYDGVKAYIDKKALTKISDTADVNQQFVVDNSNKRNDTIYENGPWNFIGGNWYKTTSEFLNGQTITVSKYVTGTNGVKWAEFSYEGSTYWVDSRALKLAAASKKDVDYTATIVQNGRNDALYLDMPWEFGAQWYRNATDYAGKDVEVTQTWETADGVTWAQIKVDNKVAYIDIRGLKAGEQVSTLNESAVIAGSDSGHAIYKTEPWNFASGQWFKSAKEFAGETVQLTKKMIGSNGVVWLSFVRDGQVYWLDQRAFDKSDVKKSVDYTATIDQSSRGDALYYDKPWSYGASWAQDARNHQGEDVQVIEEWTTSDGVTWAGFRVNDRMMYMDVRGLKKIADASTNVNLSVIIDQTGRNDAVYLKSPWNFMDNAWFAYSGSILNGEKIQVLKQIRGGNGVIWYQFKYGNELAWVDASATIPVTSIKNVEYRAKIDQSGRGDALYLDKPWEYGSKWLKPASELDGQIILVNSEWTARDGVVWVGFTYQGQQVYVDKRAISTQD